MDETIEMFDEMQRVIEAAVKHNIPLTTDNFKVIDGGLTIDGMDPAEWLDAMTME